MLLLQLSVEGCNLILSSSDGSWDEGQWKRPRRLYEQLWPGESISCPWENNEVEESDSEKESVNDTPLRANLA